MRFRRFLALSMLLVATADLTVIISDRLGQGDAGADGISQVIAGGSTSSTDTVAPMAPTAIVGTLSELHVERADLDGGQVPTPFTIEADRGFGNGLDLTGVAVNGLPSVLVWDGGRPFEVASGGTLLLGLVTADLEGDGIRASLAGGDHHLSAGTYHVNTPVAVGSSGVATSVETVTFDADADTRLNATGNASVRLPPATYRMVVRGALHLEGSFSVAGAASPDVSRVDADGGVTELTLTATSDGGWTVSAAVGGQVTTDR